MESDNNGFLLYKQSSLAEPFDLCPERGHLRTGQSDFMDGDCNIALNVFNITLILDYCKN
jgi:hypothetical protein